MSTAPVIELDEWLAELGRLEHVSAEEGFTAAEVRESTGLGHNAVQQRIVKGIRSGRLRFIGRRPSQRVDGARCHTPVYALVKAEKGGK